MKKITRISLSLMMLALFAAGGCRDETPIDPRTGVAFTTTAMGKLAKFAEECEDRGRLSKQSLKVLVKQYGFAKKHRSQLKTMCRDRLASRDIGNDVIEERICRRGYGADGTPYAGASIEDINQGGCRGLRGEWLGGKEK